MLKQLRTTALALAGAATLATAVPAQAQNDLPTCVVRVFDAYVAHYGPGADSTCNAIDAQSAQIVYGSRPKGTLQCTLASTADIPTAFVQGEAVVVYDNSIAGDGGQAAWLCSYYQQHGDYVVDQNWEPYQP